MASFLTMGVWDFAVKTKCPLIGEWIMKTPYITWILLSLKKEWNWVICTDVDGTNAFHTEWSKSERVKQTLYTNACIWNLEKWYRWTYFPGQK